MTNFFIFYLTSTTIITYKKVDAYHFAIFRVGLCYDAYRITFLTLLGIVSFCVFIWSFYYINRDKSYNTFTFLLRSFIIAIVVLIIRSNLCCSLVGWDCLGITSFLLILYYKNRKALGSGIITALSNRMGDCFLLCLLGVSYYAGLPVVLLVLISMTKRAQFPFSAWLPAAMAAPTPVRALVHSSTLVTSGVYILIRYIDLDQSLLIALGSFTIIIAGINACVERDFKKVVALSTLSQLGIIFVALGINAKIYCFFHLITHALFKSLLFICVGVCMHTVYGSQDYRSFNMNENTSFFMTTSCAALLGLVFTSGFYSKEGILEVMMINEFFQWSVFFYLIGICLTVAYSLKMITTIFLLQPFSSSSLSSLGGIRWQCKIPIYILAISSIAFKWDIIHISLLHNVFIPLSLLVGFSAYLISRLNILTWMSIFTLVPNTQSLASVKYSEDGFTYLHSFSYISHAFPPIIIMALTILMIW